MFIPHMIGSESLRERIGLGPIGWFAPGMQICPGAKRLWI